MSMNRQESKEDSVRVLFSGDILKMRDYLELHPEHVNYIPGNYENFPIVKGIFAGRMDIVDLFLEFKFDVNLKDIYGRTCLDQAVECESSTNIDIINRLINAGASGNNQDSRGKTPLHNVVKHTTDPNIIHTLYLVTDPNIQDKKGKTALIKACCYNKFYGVFDNSEVIKALCQYTNVNIQDKFGKTALHEACSCNNVPIVKILLDHGADPHIKSFGYSNDNEEVDEEINVPIVKFLLEHVADPHIKSLGYSNDNEEVDEEVKEWMKWIASVDKLTRESADIKRGIMTPFEICQIRYSYECYELIKEFLSNK